MFMYYLMCILILIAVIGLLVCIIRLPIVIATARGVAADDLFTIGLLSWLGIILGVTWVVALVLSFVWSGSGARDTTVEKLTKLAALKKSGTITAREFTKMKNEILGK